MFSVYKYPCLNVCLEKDESVRSNFAMYNLHDRYVDVWMGDQMNTALKRRSMFDAIVTDRKCQHYIPCVSVKVWEAPYSKSNYPIKRCNYT